MILASGIVVILAILLGIRIGSMGVAFSAGLGLFILTMICGLEPGSIPINVVLIIAAVISVIAALESSGGLDILVKIASNILKNNPKQINILAPMVTFSVTVLAGTGHIAYSIIPVIIEVAKKQGIQPVRPLSSAVVASQVGITASPISAATLALLIILEPLGIGLGKLMLVLLPSAILSCILVGVIQGFFTKKLIKNENYENISILNHKNQEYNPKNKQKKNAGYALIVFILAVILIIIYEAFPSIKPLYSSGKKIDVASLIVAIMLSVGLFITLITKIEIRSLVVQSTFVAGMSAILCVIGVAWLGDTFIFNYKPEILNFSGEILKNNQWAFAIILFFLSALLYSQAATTLAIVPIAIALNLSPLTIVASFVAVSGLFILPTYPTLIAAVQMDYTGSTKIGKYIFNHPFLIPGMLTVGFSVIFAYIIGNFVI